MGVMATAELGQDTDFSASVTTSIQERLFNLISQARKLGRKSTTIRRRSRLDRWMLNQLNETVKEASDSMEKLRVRQVINRALYQLDNDLSWYQRRLGPKKPKNDSRSQVLREVLETRARLLAPIAPHTAEEIWSLLGNRGLVAKASWPEADPSVSDLSADQAESLVRQTLEDTSEILKATGLGAKRVVYYTAADWKWKIFLKAHQYYDRMEAGAQGDFIRDVMSEPEFRKLGKASAEYAGKMIRQVRQSPPELRKERMGSGQLQEKMVLQEAVEFFSTELKAKVEVWGEDDSGTYDPKGRARLAEPYRPAIFVE